MSIRQEAYVEGCSRYLETSVESKVRTESKRKMRSGNMGANWETKSDMLTGVPSWEGEGWYVRCVRY